MDGSSVYDSRLRMGYKLAETIRKTLGQDVVDGIDAGRSRRTFYVKQHSAAKKSFQ
jgi:glutamine phosphoribosylpyrophosphate amidotransferase